MSQEDPAKVYSKRSQGARRDERAGNRAAGYVRLHCHQWCSLLDQQHGWVASAGDTLLVLIGVLLLET